MKLSKRCEYALKALTELAIDYDKGVGSTLISYIAERDKIPQRYLEQILLRLKNAGILLSKRGVGGGYALNRPPEKVNIGEIISVVDGPLVLIDSSRKSRAARQDDEISATLDGVMKGLSDSIKEIIEGVSLEDLARQTIELTEHRKKALSYVI